MTFAGRGLSVITGLLSDGAKIVSVLALLLLCSHSWADCRTYTTTCNVSSVGCGVSGNACRIYYDGDNNCQGPKEYGTLSYNGVDYPIINCTNRSRVCVMTGGSLEASGGISGTINLVGCSTQSEADSALCAINPTAAGCVEEDVPPSCQADYSQCVGLGGVWRKVASTSSECASECDLCNSAAQTRVMNSVNKVCCQKGLAPPDSATRCIPPTGGSQGGMQSSQFINNDGNISCGALSTSDGEIIQENAALYKRFCVDHDDYEEQVDTNDVGGGSSSSGGEGSSSSEDIGHSFGTELEALGGLYGVLDTIRDTLVKRLTPATEEIRDCLYNFKLCTALEPLQIDWTGMPQDTNMLQIDTAILKHIKPMMDSSVKLDSAQLKVLKSLDSLYKKGLVNDSQMRILVNDISGSVDAVKTAVNGVKHGIDSLIDSMTTYMDKVGQGIGAVGDSIGALRGDFNGFLEGEGTVPGDTTWDGYSDVYDEGSDSIGNSYLRGLGGQLDSAINDTAFDRIFAPGGGTLGPADSARLPTIDSMQHVLDSSIVAQRSELEDTLHAAFDSLKDEFMLLDYDSLILAPLGVRVPNTNTCPEHCFTFDISGESSNQNWLGDLGTLDFGFCRNLPGLGFDVFFLIRIIGRLFTAMFCIYIGLWFIAGRKN